MLYPSASLYPSESLYPSSALYPSEQLYPSETLYPNDGEATERTINSSFTGGGTLTTVVTVPVKRTNLFRTPSLESVLPSEGNVTQTLSTTSGVIAGTKSLALTPSNVSNDSYAQTNGLGTLYGGLTEGKTYTLSGHITLTASLTGTIESNRGLKIVVFTRVGTGSYTEVRSTAAPNTVGTSRLSIAFTVPVGATETFIRFYHGGSSGSGTVYWDGILIEEGSTLGDYFDGSTAKEGYTYAWSGTPHDSASTETVGSAPKTITSGFSGSGSLTTKGVHPTIRSAFSGSGTLATALLGYKRINSSFSGSGSLSTALEYAFNSLNSEFSGTGTLTSLLSNYRRINSAFSGTGTLSTTLVVPEPPAPPKSIASAFSSQGVLYSELFYTRPPAELGTAPLGKRVSFSVSTSAVPLNPAEGSGATPSVNAGYIKGLDPEFALGETNVLDHGSVGVYEGEIVRLSLPEGSDVASISQDTALTLLNNELHLFPFIDAAPSLWTAARAVDYWTQQCGLFYDKVPGDCIAYASGFGHTDSYGAQNTARFYEKLAGGATATTVLNGRSVKTLGSAVTGTTAFHELPNGNVPVSVPKNHKLVASVGLGLRGAGRTGFASWNFIDGRKSAHGVVVRATSAGSITAYVGGVPAASATVPANADYRITFSMEKLSPTAVVGKLTVHTDDLSGSGELVYTSSSASFSYALPAVMYLTSMEHTSEGGSGAEMLRWGTYLSITSGHPTALPAVQKSFSPTGKEFGFVSGFEGNVWALLNEYCAITRQDVSFLDGKLNLTPRIAGLSVPRGNFSRFSRDSERRDKYKQVAVVNKQSKAVSTNDAVLWRADSVYQVAAREIFETTVQTGHSILSLVQPVPVDGIWPFPYKQGGGQYVVTGADGYIIAPAWWNDNGGKVEVSLTGKEGEIAIKITAPDLDTVRAPYRISEGEADRPALYVCGSGILNDPKEVHVGTGASNAKEGFDNVFESPFISGVMETYDTAAAMAAQYSASVADVGFELPNDPYTPSRFGQYPAGTRFTDGKRNYRISSASQTHSRVSGSAVPHTTIGDYVASYPAGATLADEKARHAGRTIKQFNISPLRGS